MVAWDPAWGEEDEDAPLYERQMARLKAFSQKPLKGLTCDGSPAISPSYHCSRSPPSQLSPRLLLPSVLCVHCGRSLCSAMLRCGGCGWWLKGWNSCGAFFWSVSEEEMRANVELTVQLLQPSGYSFIELDWYWYLDLNNATTYLDQFGRPQPDPNRWPNSTGLQGFTRLVEYIHGKGLMFGLHIMRGVSEVAVEYALPIEGTNYTAADVYDPDRICPWSCVPVSRFYATKKDHPASQPFYDSLLRQYAAWGVELCTKTSLRSEGDAVASRCKRTDARATARVPFSRPYSVVLCPKLRGPMCGASARRAVGPPAATDGTALDAAVDRERSPPLVASSSATAPLRRTRAHFAFPTPTRGALCSAAALPWPRHALRLRCAGTEECGGRSDTLCQRRCLPCV